MTLIEVNTSHPSLLERRLPDGARLEDALLGGLEHWRDAHARLLEWRGRWPIGWLELPQGGAQYAESVGLGKRLREEYETLIVCGIGGSALGTQAVYAALDSPAEPLQSVYVLDNADPTQIAAVAERVDWGSTAVNVISKSGETLETMSGFLFLLRLMQEAGLDAAAINARIIATTDASKGLLRELATARDWAALPVPGDVGGRFSVFSPVGIFPLAFAGANTDGLIGGARGYQETLLLRSAEDNDALRLALLHYLLHTQGGLNICVQYTYGDPLVLLGDWFRQLWAESLAKGRRLDGAAGLGCMTPITARGSTDQHSQNQLYMEGPDDKLYGFVSAREWEYDPALDVAAEALPPGLGYLGGQSFGAILEACRSGTRDALIEAGRPVYEINFPRVTAFQVGAYLQLWMLATAYAGLIYDVNPFDQPGVERSKQLTRALMGG